MIEAFRTKKDVAVDRLRRAIDLGQIKLGEPLRQNDLARDLGLSSTPVREALMELQRSGLVTYESHRGVRVSKLTAEKIEKVYGARQIIESEISRLAFPNLSSAKVSSLENILAQSKKAAKEEDFEELVVLDEEFHMLIMNACGNEYLVKSVTDLWRQFPRYLDWNVPSRIEESRREHNGMVQQLKLGKKTEFIAATKSHLRASSDMLLKHMDRLNEAEGVNSH
jgi:DNA-binding GntR family transcriptional regulator